MNWMRWDIRNSIGDYTKIDPTLHIMRLEKRTKGKYDLDYIKKIDFSNKYIYKGTKNYRRVEFDGKWSSYIISNKDLDYLMDFFNQIQVVKMISNEGTIYRSMSLYKIKDKIETL